MLPGTVRPAGRVTLALLVVVVMAAGCGGREQIQPAPTHDDPAVVQTAAGVVRGVVSPGHRLFAGIPYAAPPVGELRWQPPQPPPAWSGVRDATQPGPRCIQNPEGDFTVGRQTDEDCLTLDVWTPPAGDDLRPVMVWIHGGGFVNGSGSLYDARRLAERGDIVVVTVNYRLGALGFLAHPSLGPDRAVGNYGLADQQAALRWVRDNIAHFGGDPDKVTLAGESAGGMSVCDHLVAPDSVGLYRAAIIASAPCQAQADLATAEQRSLDYAAERGCGDPQTAAQCLRALPVDRLRKAVWYVEFSGEQMSGPATGTTRLPVDPVTAISAGSAAQVPVLIGTNRDEFTLFVALQYLRQGTQFTAAQYPQLLADAFGADARAVMDHYPVERYGSVPLAYAAAATDGLFACVADRMANDLSRSEPVYAYEFNDRNAPAPEPLRTVPFPVGASHSLELRYLFDVGNAPPLNSAQQRLSEQMIDYWSQFVSTGAPGWPVLGEEGKRMSLRPDTSQVVIDFETRHQCAFWAGLRG